MASSVKQPLVAGAFLLVFVVAACSGSTSSASPSAPVSSAPTVAPTEAATPSPTPEVVVPFSIGVTTAPPVLNSHFFWWTLEQGFYRDQGLDVTIKTYNGDQTGLRAVTTGDVDVSWIGCNSPLQAIDVGGHYTLISAFNPRLDFALVGKLDISRPREVEGRNLGVSQPGAVSHQVPMLMIKADGGDVSKVNVLSIGGTSARLQALVAGVIDAAMADSLNKERATTAGFRIIADARDLLPDYLFGCEFANTSFVEEEPELVQAFITGTMQGVRWFYDNVDAAAEISQELLPETDPDEITRVLREFADTEFFNSDGTLTREAYDFTIAAGVEAGDISNPSDYASVVTTEFTDAAQEALGSFTP